MIYLSIFMKKILLLISVLLSFGLFTFSQDVQFSPAVIPSGGGSPSTHAVNLSRWRIGEIHVVTIPTDEVSIKQAEIAPTVLTGDWSASVYPNPVVNRLKIQFDTNSSGEYAFELIDITGKKLITEKTKLILPGQVEELDFSGLIPAMYLLKIIPSNEGSQKLFKITKQ
jgi:hypothetical protein